MAPIDEALTRAAQHYHAGQFPAAEQLCRQILQTHPAHVHALHLLGLLAYQSKRWDEALDCYQKALRLRPDLAEIHNSQGAVLMECGRWEDALNSIQEALRLQPDYADAYHNQGTILKQLGRWQEAAASYRSALEQSCRQMLQADPADVYALHLLGLVAYQSGRASEAVDLLQEAVQRRPDLPVLHSSLGVALTEQGRLEEAVRSLREALRLLPAYAEAHNNLGHAFQKMGRREDAEASYREALRVRPDFALAHNNLGLLLTEWERFEEALGSIGEALRIQPDYAAAHDNLGKTYKLLERWPEAEASYRAALRLRPDQPSLHNDLGVALAKQKRFLEAEGSLRAGLRLQFERAVVFNSLGSVLEAQERFPEAEACYLEALRLAPAAERAFPEVFARNPVDADALENLILLMRLSGKPRGEWDERLACPETLATLYRAACQFPSDINEHCPTLYELAKLCTHVTEMGTRTGVSTTALLYAQPTTLVCYDKVKSRRVQVLEVLAGRTLFQFHETDVLTIEIEPTDLLFIDTWHVYEQLKQELARHGAKARKYLVLHDTTTFGEHGEAPEHRGLWPAIEEFLQDGLFKLKQRFANNNGLTILERVQKSGGVCVHG